MRLRSFVVSSLALLSITPGVGSAQQPTRPPAPSPERLRADSMLAGKRYQEAFDAYEKLVAAEPAVAGHWYQRAMAAYYLGRFPLAASSFEKANAVQRMPLAQYNAAAAHARAGALDAAMTWLDSAVTTRGATPDLLESDEDMAPLRKDPRFTALLERARRSAFPCMYSDEARRFDFWVGEWDVRAPAGPVVGRSAVERVSGGCALLENWTPLRGGGSGKSLTAYNAALKQWQQYWVGHAGGVTEYRRGEWRDSTLVLMGEGQNAQGAAMLVRLQFTLMPGGIVRQYGDQSTDGGKTWTTGYDLFYHRR